MLTPYSRGDRLLMALVVLSSAWLCLAMPVFAQESYYWCYGQHPDLSYFDHPPLVGWLIWLGTAVFGDGAIGIRVGAFACGLGTVLAGLSLLGSFGAGPRARRVWLLLCVGVPSLVATRFLSNPDPAVVCFWMLTLATLWRARSGSLGWWVLAGLCAGCALLSKYTAAMLAVGGVVVLLFDPMMRRQLRRPGPYLGVAVATLTFLPVIAWNVANDFESFRFQTAGRWQHATLGVHWLFEWLGGQFVLLNPVVFLVLLVAGSWAFRIARRRDLPCLWLLAFSMPLLVMLLVDSLFIQIKANWAIPAVTPLLVAVALWAERTDVAMRRPVATRRVVASLAVVTVLTLLAPLIEFVPQRRGTTWSGWEQIAARAEHWETHIDDPDGLEGNCFFFAGDYRDAAQLTRCLKDYVAATEPEITVEPTMAQNVFGRRALQFDHWEDPRRRIGQDAVFVLTRPDAREALVEEVRQYFRYVRAVERVHVEHLGLEVLTADIFVCRGYLGPKV